MAISKNVLGLAIRCGLLSMALTGCSVGPDYHGAPDSLQAKSFKRQPATGITTAPGVADWWTTFNDPELNKLIVLALQNNPDIAIAQDRLRQSSAALAGQKANLLPKGTVTAADLRMRRPEELSSLGEGGGPLNLDTVGFYATWEIDLFGGTRRAIEAAKADAGASEADLADTHVSIAAQVARVYIALAEQRQRLAMVNQSALYQQQMLELTQQRRARGAASDVDVERLVTQLETTRSQIAPLNADTSDNLDMLAFLTGREPGALDKELAKVNNVPTVPGQVAVGDPAALLQQRPDIRAAERKLASQTAQIGEHKADLFPKITLLGDIGYSASDPGHLIRKSNYTWIAAPMLQWNVLDFGRTQAQIRSAEAGRDEAQESYRRTVLDALRDANSSLSRYGHQREAMANMLQVEQSARHSSDLIRQRYKAGVASLIDLLDAERTQLSAEENSIDAKAQLATDFVALQKSMGLGWR